MKAIHITYYAVLRQERGVSQENISTNANDLRTLYSELKQKYGFKLTEEQVKVAVNAQISSWDTPLTSGDKVLLIPPVAGG